MSITYSECVSVALVIQHAMRVRRIMLSSLTFPALPYVPTVKKQHECRKKVLSETFLILEEFSHIL